MKENVPRTPFSTPLSGSAREVELRLKNIFSGPKKRPPLPLLILMACACVFCSNLVSCQVAEADVPAPPDVSVPEQTPEAWTPVELDTELLQYNETTLDRPYEFLTEEETALIQNLPAAELPREAVDLYPGPYREDFWEDLLLPVAYDKESDVTVYFIFGGMPPGTYRNINLNLESAPNLWEDGIVLRWGERTAYFPLYWGGSLHFGSNPPLLVDDLDDDGQLEAALALTDGWGTGAYTESLYIFDLDTMTYALLDYSEIPLEIALSPEGDRVKLQSGPRSLEVDVTELGGRLTGRMEVGNVVRFHLTEGHILCELDIDFTSDTLGYMARACFPLVYEDGAYRLGQADLLTDSLS